MTSKTKTVPTSSQPITSVAIFNIHILITAIFKTLALKLGNEHNNGIIYISTRRAFFKIMYNVFSAFYKKYPLNSLIDFLGQKLPFAKQPLAVFVIDHNSFEQGRKL